MLTTLSTLKPRLTILDTDTQYDALLTNAIKAVSERFDKETNRILARTENFTQEFDPRDREIIARCYPIESISKFEIKLNETDGWQEQPEMKYLVRNTCVISLISKPSTLNSQPSTARVSYTAGYVLPGATPTPGQTPLPADLENAAVEQVAFWFQNRDRLGLTRIWEYHGTYRQFNDLDLLPSVRGTLSSYTRYAW